MSWLSEFMHPEKPYQAAQNELSQYYNQAQGYQQPIVAHGEGAYGNLNGILQSLMNPQKLQNEWSSGYEESPEAKQMKMMATNNGLDAASSLGLNGSSPALQAIQGGTTQIGLDERRNYLNDLMQKYLSGAGIAQGIYGQGANAASQLGQNAMNMGQNAAELKYGEKGAKGGLFGNLLGTGVSLFGSSLGVPTGNYGGFTPNSGAKLPVPFS